MKKKKKKRIGSSHLIECYNSSMYKALLLYNTFCERLQNFLTHFFTSFFFYILMGNGQMGTFFLLLFVAIPFSLLLFYFTFFLFISFYFTFSSPIFFILYMVLACQNRVPFFLVQFYYFIYIYISIYICVCCTKCDVMFNLKEISLYPTIYWT